MYLTLLLQIADVVVIESRDLVSPIIMYGMTISRKMGKFLQLTKKRRTRINTSKFCCQKEKVSGFTFLKLSLSMNEKTSL